MAIASSLSECVALATLVCVIAVGMWLSAGRKPAREKFFASQLLSGNLGTYFVDPACQILAKDGMYAMRKFDGLERHPTISNACVVRDNAGAGNLMTPSLQSCKPGHAHFDKSDVVEKVGTDWLNGRTRCIVWFKASQNTSEYDKYDASLRDADFIASDTYQTLLAIYTAALATLRALEMERDRLQTAITARKKELAEVNAAIAQLEAQLSSLNAQIRAAEARNRALAADYAKVAGQVQGLTNEYGRLKDEYDRSVNTSASISAEISRLNSVIPEKNRLIQVTKAEVNQVQSAAIAAVQKHRIETQQALERIAKEFNIDASAALSVVSADSLLNIRSKGWGDRCASYVGWVRVNNVNRDLYRGVNVYLLFDNNIVEYAQFDTYAGASMQVNPSGQTGTTRVVGYSPSAVVQTLDKAASDPSAALLIAVVHDEGSQNMRSDIRSALNRLGSAAINRLGYRTPYVFIFNAKAKTVVADHIAAGNSCSEINVKL